VTVDGPRESRTAVKFFRASAVAAASNGGKKAKKNDRKLKTIKNKN
jgi:hypothetical protein